MLGFVQKKYHKVTKDYNRLNEQEKEYLFKNPHKIFLIKKITDIAFLETKNRFPKVKRPHNNKADAFRHCYWSALLVKELGYMNAKEFTDIHEEGRKDNPVAEKKMDLHNNKIGLELGKFVSTKSNQKIADACFEVIQKNGVWFK